MDVVGSVLLLLELSTTVGVKVYMFKEQLQCRDTVSDYRRLHVWKGLEILHCLRTCLDGQFCLSAYFERENVTCITNGFAIPDGESTDVTTHAPGFSLYTLTGKVVNYPSTCSEVKAQLNVTSDGEYWLYPRSSTMYNNRARVYCNGMNTTTPTEYVSLATVNVGVYPRKQNRGCRGESNSVPGPGRPGITRFYKIRIRPETMTVVLDDFTFATWEENRHGYAEALDCYNNYYGSAPCGPVGTFRVDTRGTGLVVDLNAKWKGFDWRPYTSVTRSEGGAVIDLLCGGWCGGCVPAQSLRLYYNHNDLLVDGNAVPTEFGIY
ncbi:A disintegrin and metalloproteinase with thrombospondin motifs gon-1-like [Haliotis cracherodii]|uniref:A disintegrin and metalloproteinase with thrombospondin motifs gon-1-like n=1 Tax=Haliotis cracherodii TaxID=6455 RepID=UPI0039EB9480